VLALLAAIPANRLAAVALAELLSRRRGPLKLTRPAKRRLPDEFYYDVSIAYTDAVEAGLNPRKTLAADSGAPADTVARWVGEARKRGHLPPGEPGKVTA
jgi:hypothetical protein